MIPSAMKATGEASGPGRDHCWRAGAPTGRIIAHPSEKQVKQIFFAVDGRCFIVRNANHMASKEPNGLDRIAESPGTAWASSWGTDC